MKNKLILQNVKIGYRNFKGEQKKFNRAGDRNFVIFLDNDLADQMSQDGWNVKFPKERDDIEGEDHRLPFIKVNVSFKQYKPSIVLINGSNQNSTRLNEDTIDILDDIDIQYCDVEISPYHYNVNGKEGINAYLSKLYVTQEANYFTDKYGF